MYRETANNPIINAYFKKIQIRYRYFEIPNFKRPLLILITFWLDFFNFNINHKIAIIKEFLTLKIKNF